MRKLTFLCLLTVVFATEALSGNVGTLFGGSPETMVPVTLGQCCYVEVTGAPACQMLPQLECSLLQGRWSPNLTCEDPCDSHCVKCATSDLVEGEPCPSLPDTFNAGCTPGQIPRFGTIACGMAVCGQAWATPGGTVPGYVDVDAYMFTLPNDTFVSLCVKAEYRVLVELWNVSAAAPCPGTFIERDEADTCDFACIQRCLPAGTYVFYTKPVFGQSIECLPYRLVMHCRPCCAIECPPTALHEDEPACSPSTIDFNAGCLGPEPYRFTEIECNQIFCGTSWLFKETDSTGLFDVDAYQVVVTSPTRLTYCIAADFNVSYALVSHSAVTCIGSILHYGDTTECDTACFSVCVPAGVYDFYVAGIPQRNESFSCGHYVARLACEPCTSDTCDGTDAVYFQGLTIPQCECVYLCPGTTVPIWVCTPTAHRARPPIVSITSGCATPDRGTEHCAEACDPISTTALAFSNANWIWDDSLRCWKNYIVSYGYGCACICLDGYLAVELQSFSAVSGNGSVTLSWQTASERENDHFEILRNGHIATNNIRATNNPAGSRYSWTDLGVSNGFTYSYELVAVDMNGNRTNLGSTNATPVSNTAEVITEYALRQNYPNPFNPVTSISFDLVDGGPVTLKVFNPMGQEVATVASGGMTSGRHTVTFDASNLPSGMYLYRLEANGFSATKKMLLMK